MSKAAGACVRAGLRLGAPSRALAVAVPAPGEGRRGAGGEDGVRSFQEIPHTGRSGWINLVQVWREDGFRLLHKRMERTFQNLGPIYREKLGTQSSVNIMLPGDVAQLYRSEGPYPRRMILQPWATHRETRQHSKGIFLKNGEEWRSDRLLLNKEVMVSAAVRRFLPLLDQVARDFCRMLGDRVEAAGGGLTLDPSPDLFRFALEASCHVLYGERVGLFSSSPSLESEKFIMAVERMLATTPPLLYLPTSLLERVGASLWTQHAAAWDHIFSQAESSIQRGFRRLSSEMAAGTKTDQYSGVLGQLLEKGQLSQDLIKANITELMAGAVDTVSVGLCVCGFVCVDVVLPCPQTAVPLQFALFELSRNVDVQDSVRQQVKASWAQAGGDPHKALQGAPLLKGTVKEILRLYPVGIAVQRYPVRDIILHNYKVPAGTMVQVCLYPLGRSAEVFDKPLTFDPGRWGVERGGEEGAGFRSLAFGFGARQCVGRRIADNEIQLCLMHILLNFHLSVSSSQDLDTKVTLILQPETPPRITFRKI
ncbi:cytochrome P450 11C1 isoform X1 [Nerophis lumbriciformis]|uniref:cytochrome P450 11C1 isoform X1 n=1 Tax=Nerophis lumbriciformis TaxID=546530 RepID=UPI003BA8CAF8